MLNVALPVIYVVLLWWSLTGLVLYLDGLPRRTFPVSLGVAALLAVLAVAGILGTRSVAGAAAAYCAFSCAVIVWGVIELTYLTGVITGPVAHPCPEGVRGLRRFSLALQTSLYHELLVVCVGVALWTATRGEPNRVAFATFAVLWGMRWSAKLNAYFGVRNLNENWLPEHLRYLASYMRQRAMNPFFPISVGVASLVAVMLYRQLSWPADATTVGQLLVLTLLVLALLEHALLVLPLDASAAWGWGFRSRARDSEHG